MDKKIEFLVTGVTNYSSELISALESNQYHKARENAQELKNHLVKIEDFLDNN